MDYKKIMIRLNNALNQIDLAYSDIAKKNGLTFNSLMLLYIVNDSVNVTQKQICDRLHLPKSTVHSILKNFISKNLLVLVNGSNKKEKYIHFTTSGIQQLEKVFKEIELFESNILSTLGVEKCSQLITISEQLSSIVENEIIGIENTGGNKNGN
ncbi:MarR family transcriptional regulator [Enterococcus sp. DIV0242_7C1]|uniref:HTH marR-type domain-containing protein n=1 Tax=Candidatus Enterococcus dunnyi TaxID=1834192 RepID=A0A200JCT7_9ENTE|nr:MULTISPECIES: MarR family transcriptional regulator [unclassified Enterococcus]MBO0471807.1 MarR family transcriptional regulator [Enterococcus sp. DIV0242_7C1]OUZ34681.1 hypothetical protein A5889_000156 [Enterococcus sp. 9D6_DIV0238]